jgi:hypothetical protein
MSLVCELQKVELHQTADEYEYCARLFDITVRQDIKPLAQNQKHN